MKLEDLKPDDDYPPHLPHYLMLPLTKPSEEYLNTLEKFITCSIAFFDIIRLRSTPPTLMIKNKKNGGWIEATNTQQLKNKNVFKNILEEFEHSEFTDKKLNEHDCLHIPYPRTSPEMPFNGETYKYKYKYFVLKQPTPKDIKNVQSVIDKHGGSFVLSYVEIALDIFISSLDIAKLIQTVFETYAYKTNSQSAGACYINENKDQDQDRLQRSRKLTKYPSFYFEGYKWKNNERLKRFGKKADRPSVGLVLYSDLKSKLNGKPCLHIEFRFYNANSKSSRKRLGTSLIGLLSFDFIEFFENSLEFKTISKKGLLRLYDPSPKKYRKIIRTEKIDELLEKAREDMHEIFLREVLDIPKGSDEPTITFNMSESDGLMQNLTLVDFLNIERPRTTISKKGRKIIKNIAVRKIIGRTKNYDWKKTEDLDSFDMPFFKPDNRYLLVDYTNLPYHNT